jgi:hypothetical protein
MRLTLVIMAIALIQGKRLFIGGPATTAAVNALAATLSSGSCRPGQFPL